MPSRPLPAGILAPGFILPAEPGRRVSLEELRRRPVVLVFYPADWSAVVEDQMTLYSALRSEWDRLGAEVFAISVDGPWCHAAFRAARNVKLTLLADFEPKGAVSRVYGAYDLRGHQRAGALRDRSRRSHPLELCLAGRGESGADGILEALETLDKPEAAAKRSAP